MARGNADAQLRAAAELRRRRKAGDSAGLVEFFREWALYLAPEYAEGIAALPDEAFRPTTYRNPEGYGQNPDEVRERFLELLNEIEE